MEYIDLISIDPSRKTGIALWIKDKLLDAFEVDYCFDYFDNFFKDFHPRKLAIELQFYNGSAFTYKSDVVMKKIKTLINLVEIRTEITSACRVHNPFVQIIGVPPSAWQHKILNLHSKTTRYDRKQASIEFVNRYLKAGIISDNISDAICIGIYAIQTMR